jgi:hypothetical protein
MKDIKRQTGASLLTAVFLITGLALLAALMTRMTVIGSTETINEWYSAQSLYAAESGIDWTAFQITTGAFGCAATNSLPQNVTANTSFTVNVNCQAIGGRSLYQITSTGSTNTPFGQVQRRLVVEFMP